ncbi:MAG: hypothetical protein MUE36_11030 [Acidimicrobiales bacterium]|nr:hypothetical protein [Acidimicrobiales bacterium]
MTVTVYLPDSEPGPPAATMAPSPASLAGLRIAVLDNGKPNADVVMTAAAEALARRTGATVSLVTKKGPRGESANAAVRCDPDIFEQVVAEADLVITGAADCGSCTAYSVTDAIELEKAGRPAVVATTTQFEPVATTLSTSFGQPHTRLLVLPHPIGGTDADTLGQWAEAATDELITLFTTPRG